MDRICEPLITVLEERAKRVQLKGKPLKSFPAADDMDVEIAEGSVTLIDPTISIGKYQQTQMNKAKGFHWQVFSPTILKHI